MFLAGLWVSGCFVSFLRAPTEDRSEGIGIKEEVPASQSALLLEMGQPFHVKL